MTLLAICGGCDRPARNHPFPYLKGNYATPGCERQPESIGFSYWTDSLGREVSDYHVHNGNIVLIENFEGTPARERIRYVLSEDDDVEYVTANDDLEVVLARYLCDCPKRTKHKKSCARKFAVQSRWNDKNEHEYSRVRDYSYRSQKNVPYKPGFKPKHDALATLPHTLRGETYFNREAEERTAYVEGQAGFIAKKFIDLVLTEAYNNRLLNVFQDKQTGELRVGGMRISSVIDTNGNASITATCVTPSYRVVCSGSTTINLDTATVEDKQWFIYVVIAHGNNHAAAWFHDKCDHAHRKVSDHNADCISMYYKVHHPSCDLDRCDYKVATCNYHRNNDATGIHDFLHDEVVLALSEHVSTCHNNACDCIHTLNREVNVLLEGVAA